MTSSELIQSRIHSIETIDKLVFMWRYLEDTVVFTNGVFDILHKGHIDYLMSCKDLGDKLVVAINSDASTKRLKGEERPINNENDRAEAIASLMFVDAVIIFDEDTPIKVIEVLKPDVLAKGADYTVEEIVGSDFVLSNGGSVERINYLEGYSTSSLIEKIKGH